MKSRTGFEIRLLIVELAYKMNWKSGLYVCGDNPENDKIYERAEGVILKDATEDEEIAYNKYMASICGVI